MSRFVCIDVETANEWFGSICQVGIALFEEGRLIREWDSLVNPECNFSEINIGIHGIQPQQVKRSPTFKDVYPDIKQFIGNDIVACYGHFDKTAFRQACEADGLELFDNSWVNLHSVVRRAWAEQFSEGGWGLAKVCNFLNIMNNHHHNALADAKAAGHVFLQAQEITGIVASEWPAVLQARKPYNPANKYNLLAAVGTINLEGPLAGETIVFTGQLEMSRSEAMVKAAQLGCTPQNGVTKKTSILVVGDQDLNRVGADGKSSKHEKAEQLIVQGCSIRIVSETDFLAMLKAIS